MKIGFSFGRCLRDIVNGEVDIDEVVVLITRTHMKDLTSVKDVVFQYLGRQDYLYGLDSDQCFEVAETLWASGRIHQPRLYGQGYASRPENLIWMDLYPCVKDMSPAVESAWNEYRLALALVHSNELAQEDIDESTYRYG